MAAPRRAGVGGRPPGRLALRSCVRRKYGYFRQSGTDFGVDADRSPWLTGQTRRAWREVGAPVPTSNTPGALLKLIRQGTATTRAQLVDLTGMARSTVSQRIDDLLANQLLLEVGGAPSTGGRPPTLLEFNRDAGVVLAADLGATHSRLAVCDLMAEPISRGRLSARHRRRTGCRARLGGIGVPPSPRRDGACRIRRHGHRNRAAGTRGVRFGFSRTATDHARLAPLRRARPARSRVFGSNARRQRRQHHDPRRMVGAGVERRRFRIRQGRHRDRLRPDPGRNTPARQRRGGRRHRPHPGR